MRTPREPIYAALFALVSGAASFVTKSRTLKHWNDVKGPEQPAIFQAQKSETVMRETRMPPKWLLRVDLYVYVKTAGAGSPGEILNPLLDALDAALGEPFPGQPQTLGGLVEYARIAGAIETSEGTLGDQEVAIVPIEILVP